MAASAKNERTEASSERDNHFMILKDKRRAAMQPRARDNASSFVGVVHKLDCKLIGFIPLSINQSDVIFAVSVRAPSPEA
jgi:hypothetical protein